MIDKLTHIENKICQLKQKKDRIQTQPRHLSHERSSENPERRVLASNGLEHFKRQLEFSLAQPKGRLEKVCLPLFHPSFRNFQEN
jgi:hypothetical protein